MHDRILRCIALAALSGAAACASNSAGLPTIAPDAEVTIDGLYRMENTVMALGYAKRDLDLSPYTAFILDPVSVSYQKDPGNSRRTSLDNNFALSERQMADLKRMYQEEVEEALTENDGYELVSRPGPNVARLTPFLLDLVVRIPTDRPGGRSRIYVASYGEVTMVVELRDSQSGEILARVGDRQDPTSAVYQLSEVSTTYVRGDVTRLFRHWATMMRERLDQLRAASMSN